MIRIKRVYEPPSPEDGRRVLVDRLWPRGVRRQGSRIDSWRPDLAPSHELRQWFGHRVARFPRFRERYRMELLRHHEALVQLAVETDRGPVTLLFAAKDPEHSNAAVLCELLEEVTLTRGVGEVVSAPRAGEQETRPRPAKSRPSRRRA